MRRAIEETARRRATQERYNAEHGITPESIRRAVDDLLGTPLAADYSTVPIEPDDEEEFESEQALAAEIERLDLAMRKAADRLEFEEAAALRDRIQALRKRSVLA